MGRALALLPLLRALFLVAIATAQAAEPEFPPLTGRVNDRAGLLSERDQRELEAALARFEAETTDQIVVVTVASLQGLPIEEYGYQLGRHWGIGQKGKDNGALLIVAPEEREVRIEVGYGLEGELTDAQSRTIIETRILPHFRGGDFAAGIKAGVAAMIETLGGSYDPALAPVQPQESDRAPSPFPLAIALPIIMIILLNLLFASAGEAGFATMARRSFCPTTGARGTAASAGAGGAAGSAAAGSARQLRRRRRIGTLVTMAFLSEQDRQKIASAITETERRTSGEIVAVIAPAADDYLYVPLLWPALAALFLPAILLTIAPGIAVWTLYALPRRGRFSCLLCFCTCCRYAWYWCPNSLKRRRASHLAREQFYRAATTFDPGAHGRPGLRGGGRALC